MAHWLTLVAGLVPGPWCVVAAQPDTITIHSGVLLPAPGATAWAIVEDDFTLPPGTVLPRSVDLSPWFPPAGNQHEQYSCAAWALAYGLMSFRDNYRTHSRPAKTGSVDPARVYSPSFVFNLVKQFIDTAGTCLDGVDFNAVFALCVDTGCCKLAEMPYDTAATGCMDPVPNGSLARAAEHRLPDPVKLDSYDPVQWRYHLAQGEPIVALIVMDSTFVWGGFQAGREGREFIWRHRNYRDMYGGHAVVVTGYDDHDSTFTILNSFGTDWSRDGYCKATLRAMQYHCGGGYVFSNEEPLPTDTLDGRPADKNAYTGERLEETFKPGEYQRFNEVRLRLVSAEGDRDRVRVEFIDDRTQRVLRTITFDAGRPISFYENGRRYTFSYRKRSALGRLLRLPPFHSPSRPVMRAPIPSCWMRSGRWNSCGRWRTKDRRPALPPRTTSPYHPCPSPAPGRVR